MRLPLLPLLLPLLLGTSACDGPSIPLTDDSAALPDDTGTDDTGGDDTSPGMPPAEALTLSVHAEVATLLVASWTQLVDGDTSLSWTLDGEVYTSPVRATAAGPASEVVLGLPAETPTTVTLHVTVNGVTSTLDAVGTTGPLPDPALAPTLTLRSPEADSAPYFLTSVNTGPQNFFGPCWVVIVDREGRVIWYRETPGHRLTLFPRVAQAGTHLIWEGSSYYVRETPGILRATLSLGQAEETEIPSLGFTWDELPDGSLLYDEAETGYDYYLTRRAPDGTEQRIWSCAPWMDTHSQDYWACAVNTVLWNPATNLVTWSMFQTSTVVAIDLDTGGLAWELGDYPGGLRFAPSDVQLMLQHYPNWTPDGTLLLTSHVPGLREQHIRELAIDTDAGVATQVWDYVSAEGYYGDYAGEATRLPNGDTLVNFGTDGVVQEVTAERDVVWEIDWSNHLVGHLTPLTDLYALDQGW